MSYLIFARKYRPGRFEDVVAQEHVTRTLRNAIKNDRIGSGYLFCGPRGTGKTTVARILAKAINCEKGPTEEPCGVCSACTEIAAGASMDVLEIDAASNTGVDDIRTLRENVRYLPTSGKKRIYIIDEVHRLSGSAFDALLKTLEEPPEHVIFMFATTEPLKVPETILSRTQRFDFRRVSVDDLAAHLRKITDAEQIEVDDAALILLARKADGSVRDSLSLLDQIAAFAGDKIAVEDVVNGLGLVDRKFLFDFVEAVAATDKKNCLILVKQIFEAGVDVKDFTSELLEHLRLLLILSNDDEAGDLLNLSESELKEYSAQAELFTVGDVLRLMKILTDLNRDLRSGLDERLLLEVSAVKMATMESTVRFEDIIAQMQSPADAENGIPNMFNALGQKKKIIADRTLPAAHSPEITSTNTEVQPRLNLAQVRAGWGHFLTHFQGRNRMLASQLNMAQPKSLNESVLLLTFPSSAAASMQLVGKPENIKLIAELLREHFGRNFSIKLDIDPEQRSTAPEEEQKVDTREMARKLVSESPRLKKIIELVDGEIIGIRKVE